LGKESNEKAFKALENQGFSDSLGADCPKTKLSYHWRKTTKPLKVAD